MPLQHMKAVVCLLLFAVLACAAGYTPAQSRHLGAHAATKSHKNNQLTTPSLRNTESSVSLQASRVPLPLQSFQQVASIAAQPSSSSSSSRRELQQAQALSFNNLELPRLNVGKVKASVVNTYSWSIERQASASGVAVTADGYSRKQLGYQLTFTRTLQKQEYRLEGVAAITNPSGVGSASLLSVSILVAGREVTPPCQGMPTAPYELPPPGVIECPFVVTWQSDLGADVISGFVQTSFGRATATSAPVAYDFADCGSGTGDGERVAPCSVVENAACVLVTDGSYIVNKYKDKLGQVQAGTVTRSRLFETSAVQDSALGPPRIEPATPVTPAAPQAVRPVPDTPPEWTPRMPDASWWNANRRRHRALLTELTGQARQASPPADTHHLSSSSDKVHATRRSLLAAQVLPTRKEELVASFDANFQWPYPTVTGDRPPVGMNGRPERGAARQICSTRTFSYGMAFGPLLPAACGTFEVQNYAGAVPTDATSAAVTSNTYSYLQVLCPTAAVQEKAVKLVDAAASNSKAPATKGRKG